MSNSTGTTTAHLGQLRPCLSIQLTRPSTPPQESLTKSPHVCELEASISAVRSNVLKNNIELGEKNKRLKELSEGISALMKEGRTSEANDQHLLYLSERQLAEDLHCNLAMQTYHQALLGQELSAYTKALERVDGDDQIDKIGFFTGQLKHMQAVEKLADELRAQWAPDLVKAEMERAELLGAETVESGGTKYNLNSLRGLGEYIRNNHHLEEANAFKEPESYPSRLEKMRARYEELTRFISTHEEYLKDALKESPHVGHRPSNPYRYMGALQMLKLLPAQKNIILSYKRELEAKLQGLTDEQNLQIRRAQKQTSPSDSHASPLLSSSPSDARPLVHPSRSLRLGGPSDTRPLVRSSSSQHLSSPSDARPLAHSSSSLHLRSQSDGRSLVRSSSSRNLKKSTSFFLKKFIPN